MFTKNIFKGKYKCEGKWDEDIKIAHDKMYEEAGMPEGAEAGLDMPPLTLEGVDEYKTMC